MFRRSGLALSVVALTAVVLCTPGQGGVPTYHSLKAPECAAAPTAPACAHARMPAPAPGNPEFLTETPPVSSVWPPPLIYVPLVYDPYSEEVLLVGGQHWDEPWLDPYVRALDPDLRIMPGNGAWPPSRPLPGPMRDLWRTIGPMVPEYDLVTYDVAAGRVIATVSFLWNSAWEPASQTWSFDPESGTWEERSPVDSPPPGLCGCGSQAAYSTRAGKTIAFGGIDIVGYFACLDQGCTDEQWMALDSNDTWVYDHGTNQWTRMPRPADESQIPVPRNTHALAYDPDTDRVVLFGGDNGLVSLDDTWIYDYSANRWTKVETDVHPSARDYGQLVYDRDSRRMVLFGGLYYENTEETLCEPETWTFDLATLTWEKMAPPTSPAARAWHGMAYSDAARAVVLYGGGPLREEPTDELWLYSVKKDSWWQVPKQ